MLINFCHPCLNPTLSCDTVSCDGYEITNLIAIDPFQQKGFLADNFIKPPITITVKLICDINLNHIILYPRVGTQKSVGFEIYASEKVTASISENQLISIGYIRNSEDCIVFSKNRKIIGSLGNVNIPFSKHIFFSRVHNFVSRVRTVSIKVIKTHQSTVPSLKRIEIWGHPSSNCDSESKKRVENRWIESAHVISSQQSVVSNRSFPQTEQVDHELELIIPEEFMDIITFNIMTMPMLLPSGKIVDMSTLEKCAKVDAQCGRVPSDPFTGEIFTEERKPIFVSTLKVRIDKFLSDNCHHEKLRNTSRTIGKRKLSDDSSSVKKICHQLVQKNNTPSYLCNHQSTSSAPDSHCIHYSASSHKNSNQLFSASDAAPEKIISEGLTRNCGLEKAVHKESSNVDVIYIDEADEEEVIVLSDDSNSSSQNALKRLYTSTSHNVDDILQKTLAGLPSFTHPVSDHVSKQKRCHICSALDTLYSLPCNHFFCRDCLLSNTTYLKVLCQECSQEFSSCVPVRFHD